MNKQEYLETLESLLKHKLSREDIEDIMRDYAEYFEEGRRQSKTDSEIAAKLGNPEIVAQELLEESIQEEKDGHGEKPSGHKNWWQEKVVSHLHKNNTEKEMIQENEISEENQKSKTEPEKKHKGFLSEFWNKWQVRRKEHKKSQTVRRTEEGLFLLSVHAFWRGVRWCIYLGFASALIMVMAGLSAGVVAAVILAAAVLGFVFLGVVLMVLAVVAGVMLSGVGFAFYQYTGFCILFASMALLGLSALLGLLCVKMFRLGLDRTKDLICWGGSFWMRIFHKVERWLIIPEKTFASQQEETVENPSQTDLPEMCQLETVEEGH